MSDTATHLAAFATVSPFTIYIILDIFPPYTHQSYAHMRLLWLMLKIGFGAGVIASIFCAIAGGITGNFLIDTLILIPCSCVVCFKIWLTPDVLRGKKEISWREFFEILRQEKEQRKYP